MNLLDKYVCFKGKLTKYYIDLGCFLLVQILLHLKFPLRPHVRTPAPLHTVIKGQADPNK